MTVIGHNTPKPSEVTPSNDHGEAGNDMPDQWENLNELAAGTAVAGPIQERPANNLEDVRSHDVQPAPQGQASLPDSQENKTNQGRTAQWLTQLYTLSYLIFFSLLGTLARVGLIALTTYTRSPVLFPTLWANVGGSLIMGYLIEEQMLFREGFGASKAPNNAKRRDDEEAADGVGEQARVPDVAATRKALLAFKKTVPLYIGLATGFCGSFTSFSSFIRDIFLALSDELGVSNFSQDGTSGRNGGYSFMAMLAVIFATVALSIGAFVVGGHLAMASKPITPSLPVRAFQRFINPAFVVLGLGCWFGAVIMSIFPPHDVWRGQVVFSLVFAPLGCLARFYLALYLNGKVASFPMGTFAANIAGTVVLGMAWDIAHAPLGGVISCQVLQGIEDGFCGCLTTISTWVAELQGLRKRHAYLYGAVSVVVALVLLIAIMGGLKWDDGFSATLCTT